MDVLEQALDTRQIKENTVEDTQLASDSEVLSHNLSIVEEDGSLGSTDEEQPGTRVLGHIDASGVQYQIREGSSEGTVTYRVVQLAGDGTSGSTMESVPHIVTTSSGFNNSQQNVQAILTTQYNGNSVGEGGQETRVAYLPAVTSDQTEGSIATLAATPSGQFYVIGNPGDVLGTTQRTIAPRGVDPLASPPHRSGGGRDERRRATHNEVERRRRDKINNWIVKLSKIIPDCNAEHSKQGQVKSKGGILSKACDFINQAKMEKQMFGELLKENERLQTEVDVLKKQCERYKSENLLLRQQLEPEVILNEPS